MNVRLLLRRLPHLLWLLVVWIALWGDLSIANILSGLLLVALLARVFTDVGPRPASPMRPLAAVALLGWFGRALVVSTWQVARLTLSRQPVVPAVIAVPLYDVSDAVATLVADMITLTPGTLTLDVRSDGDSVILYVHVLDLSDERAVWDDLMTLRRLAVEAFGDAGGEVLEEAT